MFADNKNMVSQIKLLESKKNELHDKVKDLQERTFIETKGKSESKVELN